ncbi:MAG: GNAT family N-acetyltransferase [Chloroflexota bacterium]
MIRTARLELVPLSGPFIDALKRGDRPSAEREIGAVVSHWLAIESAHLVQLHLAQLTADAAGLEALGRAMVLVLPSGRRRVIGSIGFHGPPDERGRLELGYAIDPAHRQRGYAAEAMTALFDWAATRYGVTNFLVSVPSSHQRSGRVVPIEIAFSDTESRRERIDGLGLEFEPDRTAKS